MNRAKYDESIDGLNYGKKTYNINNAQSLHILSNATGLQ